MATAYLSLGSNIAPRENLVAAVAELRERFGTVGLSAVYRTPAVGFEGGDFLNAAACIKTGMAPEVLDSWLHVLEDRQGRRRDVPRFSSRTLDIDLLLYDDVVLQGDGHLEVPRPELTQQAFVLRPMAELAPDVMHPLEQRTMAELWAAFPSAPEMQRVLLDW